MLHALKQPLERMGLLRPEPQLLHISGIVDPPGTRGYCALTVVIGDGVGSTREIGTNGRFRLIVPLDERVRLVFVQYGFLPRIVELLPSLSHLHVVHGLGPAKLDLRVEMSARTGADAQPMEERITMPRGRQPMMMERDHVVQNARWEELAPMLARA